MFKKLLEWVLPPIIGVLIHRRERLNNMEQRLKENFLATIAVAPRTTKRPLVVALIGLVGSGKSYIARELATQLLATTIESDRVRLHLKAAGYGNARRITEDAVLHVIEKGGNAVIDADFVDQKKRASLRERLKGTDARLIFIRVHADRDIMIGRVLTKAPEEFFRKASSPWRGDETQTGRVVKFREMHRRTPHHYRWESKGDGRWKLRSLPVKPFAVVDTTDSKTCSRELKKIAEKLNR